MPQPPIFPDQITTDLRRWASFGLNTSWLSQRTGFTKRQIQYAFEHGLLTKPFGTKKSIYCDYDWFYRIDTETKAYWLGFLYADGCVTDRGVIQILLARADAGHLTKFKDAIHAEHPIEERRDWLKDGKYSRWQETSKIRINSREMTNDLARLGLTPRKSLTLQFPTSDQVPSHLIRHFIRGYFDGDGSINVSYYRGSDKSGLWQVSILGTNTFVSQCGEVMKKEAGLSQIYIRVHPKTCGMSYLSYRRVGDLTRIRDYLYHDATVWLDRKYELFCELPTRYYPNKLTEIRETLADHRQEIGDIFTTQQIADLYHITQTMAWDILTKLHQRGVIVRVGKQDRYDLYSLI